MLKTKQPTENVFSLDAARERRNYINIANASEDWIQTKASFALEGIDLTDDHAERAGRLIAELDAQEKPMTQMRSCKTPNPSV